MKYYKVVFNEIPYVKFAHIYKTEQYQFAFEPQQNLLEITYIEEGDVLWRYKSGEKTVTPAPCIVCSPYLYTRTGTGTGTHKHYTFGISSLMRIYEISAFEVLECGGAFLQADAPGSFFAVIPDAVTDKKCVESVRRQIQLIIDRRAGVKPSGNIACTAAAMEVCKILTDYSFEQALASGADMSYSEIRYCEKTLTYMRSHLLENVSVANVAEAVGISVGHLSRIFKKNTGKSMIEYMNHLKINHAMMLFETKNLSVGDAARQVGIYDEKYFYRLFRRHAGMTVGEYKNLKIVQTHFTDFHIDNNFRKG